MRMPSLKFMRNRTSSIGRRQFSVENAYTVNQRRPSSSAPSTASNNASSPAACPSVRLRPRCVAQRPLPSMTAATCTGTRVGSMPERSRAVLNPGRGASVICLQTTCAGVARGVRQRLNQLRARWPWFDVVMSVQDRYSELDGNVVASAVTMSIFISLFPALLVGTAIVGYVAAGSVDLSQQLIDKLGLSGTAADTLRDTINSAQRSRKATSMVGIAGLVWASLGVVDAIRVAVDRAWQVKGNGLVDKAKSLGWLFVTGVILVASTAVTALMVSALPAWLAPLMLAVTVGINVLMFWFTLAMLGSQRVGWRPLLPGSVVAGVGLQVLTLAGAFIVPRSVASSSALYGSLGVVFAILAWLFFFGRLLVYASTFNVVLYERQKGTVTVEVEAPRIPGEVPTGATRRGVVVSSATPNGH